MAKFVTVGVAQLDRFGFQLEFTGYEKKFVLFPTIKRVLNVIIKQLTTVECLYTKVPLKWISLGSNYSGIFFM
jgi:hypothetical protein